MVYGIYNELVTGAFVNQLINIVWNIGNANSNTPNTLR